MVGYGNRTSMLKLEKGKKSNFIEITVYVFLYKKQNELVEINLQYCILTDN